MSKPIQDVSTRLRELLEMSGDSAADMARKTGLSRSVISRYLSGVMGPKADKIELIAQTYSVKEAWLLGYDLPPEPNEEDWQRWFRNAESIAYKQRMLLYAEKLSKLSDSDRTMIEDMIDRLNGGDQNGQKEIQKT